MVTDAIKILAPTIFSFFLGIAITPIVSHYLYKHKMWKKSARSVATDGSSASITESINKGNETNTPRMGGIIVWASAMMTILAFYLISKLIRGGDLSKLNLLSRNQTWLPFFTLMAGAVVGFVDDYFDITKDESKKEGLSSRKRLFLIFIVGLIGAWWFFFKLGAVSILVPFVGEIIIGWLIIPLFILVMFGIYAGGVIDGMDGLSGGVFSIIFSAYGLIAFYQNQIDLAAFSFVLVGAILAFLWFNIPPARFYLGETGSMALTVTMTVVAFLTEQVIVLPIIAFPLVVSAGSSTIQLLSKKYRGKKVFLVAPLHYHFQALGWPSYKVVMRYWVFSIIIAALGVIIALIGL